MFASPPPTKPINGASFQASASRPRKRWIRAVKDPFFPPSFAQSTGMDPDTCGDGFLTLKRVPVASTVSDNNA